MPEDKDKEFVSFADAYDEWVRQHTHGPFTRLRNSWLFPSRGASSGAKTFGCLWRIVLIATAALITFGLVVNHHLRSEAFADALAGKTKALFHADEVHLPALQWKGSVAAITLIEANGSGASFFHTLSAEGVRFRVPRLMTFKDKWHLESISMLSLDVDFNAKLPVPEEGENQGKAEKRKSAATAPVETASAPIAGFGINPRLEQLGFDVLEANQGTFRWGVSPASAGSLENGAMTLTPAGSGYALNFTSGVLNQGWLKNLRVSRLAVRYEPGAILIDECEFAIGESGTGKLSGKIATGDEPKLAIQAELNAVSLGDLLPKTYTEHATGTVDLSLKFTGSNATPEGVVCEGTMTLSEALVRNIVVFESLSTIFADPRFRRLKATSGTVEFATREGKIEIQKLELACGDFARVRANLRMEEEEPVFTGTLEFGVHPEALSKYPEIAETHFAREEDGLRWTATDLKGTVHQLTQELSAIIAEQAREINLRKKGKRLP